MADVRLKACGGLGPFTWSVAGPAVLSNTTGIATTVTCSSNSATPVVVTLTDSAGVSVSMVVGGSCVCAASLTIAIDALSFNVATQDTFSDNISTANFVPGSGFQTFYSRQAGTSSHSILLQTSNSNWWASTDATTLNTVSQISQTGVTHEAGDFADFISNGPGKIVNSVGNYPTTVGHNAFGKIKGGSDGVTNEPIFGLAVGVDPSSTASSFTGIVGAFDKSSSTLYAMSYNSQSLSGLGTVLGSKVISPWPRAPVDIGAADDTIEVLLSYQRLITISGADICSATITGDTTTWEVQVDTGGFTPLVVSGITPPFTGANMRAGIVAIGSDATHNNQANDAVIWTEVGSRFSWTTATFDYANSRLKACGP